MPRDSTKINLSAIVPVILAGGAGRRLWPLSRPARPKPFIRFPGGKSLLQRTAERVSDLAMPVIVCNERHRALVMQQVKAAQIILEPEGRNTAPAIAAAAHYLAAQGDPLLLVLPSDHAIGDPAALLEAAMKGAVAAREGMLVTFGVAPRGPCPHYGYIRAGEDIGSGVRHVAVFAEKPGKETARQYLREGGYYWNSGMFLFSAKAYLEALKVQQPAMHAAAYEAVSRGTRLQNSIFLNKESFSSCPALSIDYALMENAARRAIIPVSMGWRDLGTWPSLLTYYNSMS